MQGTGRIEVMTRGRRRGENRSVQAILDFAAGVLMILDFTPDGATGKADDFQFGRRAGKKAARLAGGDGAKNARRMNVDQWSDSLRSGPGRAGQDAVLRPGRLLAFPLPATRSFWAWLISATRAA